MSRRMAWVEPTHGRWIAACVCGWRGKSTPWRMSAERERAKHRLEHPAH